MDSLFPYSRLDSFMFLLIPCWLNLYKSNKMSQLFDSKIFSKVICFLFHRYLCKRHKKSLKFICNVHTEYTQNIILAVCQEATPRYNVCIHIPKYRSCVYISISRHGIIPAWAWRLWHQSYPSACKLILGRISSMSSLCQFSSS